MALKLHSFALAASLVAATWMLPGGAPHAQNSQVRLPSLGEAESDELSILDERRIGDQIMREIRGDPDVLDDPVLTEYLQSIVQPLVQAARTRGDMSAEEDEVFAWEPFLVRDRTFNAFALPGGFMGVHLGLIAASGSSDEMASVLGHELSHVTQRHIARSMANSKRQTIATSVAMLLGLLASTKSHNGDVPMAVVAGGQAAMATGQLTFSRDMEREADRFGLDVMTTAGFAPGGMASMFERLDVVSRLNDSNQYPWLRSHPLTIDRLAEARLRAKGGNGSATSALNRPVEHQIMRARARVLMDPTDAALRRIQAHGRFALTAPLAPADRLGALYGGALASIVLRDYPAASEQLQAARAMVGAPGAALAVAAEAPASAPTVAAGTPLSESASTAVGPPVDLASPAVRRDLALLALQLAEARRVPAEITAAAAALDRDPTRPAMLAQAEAAIARHVAGDVSALVALRQQTEHLQTWVSLNRRDALAWATLALVAEPAGQKLRAIRAEAEAHAVNGDLNGAIDRLRAAQRASKGPNDFMEGSIIDARLRELEAQRRELRKEQHLRGDADDDR